MVIFNSYVKLPEGIFVPQYISQCSPIALFSSKRRQIPLPSMAAKMRATHEPADAYGSPGGNLCSAKINR